MFRFNASQLQHLDNTSLDDNNETGKYLILIILSLLFVRNTMYLERLLYMLLLPWRIRSASGRCFFQYSAQTASWLKTLKVVPKLLFQVGDINSTSMVNALAPNRHNSLPCTAKTMRQRSCNKKTVFFVVRIYIGDGSYD